MSACVVCEKTIAPLCKTNTLMLTCSPSCAGKLAHSQALANKLRTQFDNADKNAVRHFLINKFVKPNLSCEEPLKDCRILDFWGGGLFVDAVLKHCQNVVITTLDSNKDLFPALRAHARRKNQTHSVKNHTPFVQPFCGSLAEYVQSCDVKNQISYDLIWLDYCGSIKGLDKDIQLLKPLVSNKTVIAITLFEGRDGTLNQEGRIRLATEYIKDTFPLFDLDKYTRYTRMGVFIYKAKHTLRKEQYVRRNFTPNEVPNWLRSRFIG